MTKLANDGLIRLPHAVVREVGRGDDRARDWVRRHEDLLTIVESQAIVDRQAAVLSDYGQYLTTSPGAADPMVICTALDLVEAAVDEWTVVTGDSGVQLVCHRLRIPLLPDRPFQKLFLS